MRILVAMPDREKARRVAMCLEDEHEDWACTLAFEGGQALIGCHAHDVVILDRVLPGLEAKEILTALETEECIPPPFILLIGERSNNADAYIPRTLPPEDYPQLVIQTAVGIPNLYKPRMLKVQAKAQAFLRGMGMSASLKGYDYLSYMTALILGNPALLNQATLSLYPLTAQYYQTLPTRIERCARHAIETVWSHGDLQAIDRHFGHSISPERGKPTTREFLARAAQVTGELVSES